MSTMELSVSPGEIMHGAAVPIPTAPQALHRLAEVRRLQGVTRRTLARRLNIDTSAVKLQEQATSDLLLSTLYQWQKVLEVPVSELLVETEEPLSTPVLKRAQLVRLMKTAGAILERCQQVSVRRMATMLIEQLVEIMPELEGITPWHAVGRRRSREELGQAAERRLTGRLFDGLDDC